MSLRCIGRQIEHDRPASRLQLKAFHACTGEKPPGIDHSPLGAIHTRRPALQRLHNARIKVS